MACKVSNLRFGGGVTLVDYASTVATQAGATIYTAPCKCRIWFHGHTGKSCFCINRSKSNSGDYDFGNGSYAVDVKNQFAGEAMKRNIIGVTNNIYSIELKKGDYVFAFTPDNTDRSFSYTVIAI